jgi:hypothetical protein
MRVVADVISAFIIVAKVFESYLKTNVDDKAFYICLAYILGLEAYNKYKTAVK